MKTNAITKAYMQATQAMIIRLTNEGNRLIVKAYNESDYRKDKTQNLHDSYGSAVYYNGRLQVKSKRFFGSRAVSGKVDDDGSLIMGRSEINDYLDSYIAKPRGYELVVAVAMFYGKILEAGQQGGSGRKYVVISSIADDMDSLARKVKGTVKQLGNF